jgi:hypothetical protein
VKAYGIEMNTTGITAQDGDINEEDFILLYMF